MGDGGYPAEWRDAVHWLWQAGCKGRRAGPEYDQSEWFGIQVLSRPPVYQIAQEREINNIWVNTPYYY